jgi:hypothetical protein
VFAWNRLQPGCLTYRELDRIGSGGYNRLNCGAHVLDPGQESGFIKESVIDGDIETFTVSGEKPVYSWFGEHDG